MNTASQQISCSQNSSNLRFTIGQRLLAGAILPAVVIAFAFLHFADTHGFIFYPFPCGFKAQFGLPCPTCGMTTSVLAFAQGNILRAFYIQPAAAMFCCLLIVIGIGGLIMAICGTDWGLVRQIKLKYIIVTFLVLAVGGWTVTMARAISKS